MVELVAWDPLFYYVTILTHILQTQRTFTQDKYILMLPGEKVLDNLIKLEFPEQGIDFYHCLVLFVQRI